jgi:hypothetical protein
LVSVAGCIYTHSYAIRSSRTDPKTKAERQGPPIKRERREQGRPSAPATNTPVSSQHADLRALSHSPTDVTPRQRHPPLPQVRNVPFFTTSHPRDMKILLPSPGSARPDNTRQFYTGLTSHLRCRAFSVSPRLEDDHRRLFETIVTSSQPSSGTVAAARDC